MMPRHRDATTAAAAFRRAAVRTMQPCRGCAAYAHSFCSVLERSALAPLAAIVTGIRFAPRQTILLEGEPADFLYNVTSGHLKLYRALPDGRTQVVGFLGRGDFLGVPARGRYSIGAEAITAVELCHFSRGRFARLLEQHPVLEQRLFALASNELEAAQRQMVLLGQKTIREKVATFLCDRAARPGSRPAAAPIVDLPMRRADIANYLATTPETLSRTLAALARDALIELLPGRRIRLRDMAALHGLAGLD